MPLGQHYRYTFDIAPSALLKWHTQTMAACAQCDGLLEGLSFDTPREYLELALRLLTAVKDGRLIVTESTCPLEDVFNPVWPDTVLEHNFECSACGRAFQLFADTYHGHAGWGVTGPQTREPVQAPTAVAS